MPYSDVLVLGPDAAIRVRGGALVIQHGRENPSSDSGRAQQSVRIDIDARPKPHTILFDGHGEFLTGEALRWCARYGINLILPDGPGRMLTVLQSALEAAEGAATMPDIDPAVIRAQCGADAIGIARDIVRAKVEAEGSHINSRRTDRLGINSLCANYLTEWGAKLNSANTIPQLIIIEAQAAMTYWRAFKDMGLREAKNGNLPRSWLRFANRNKGALFLGNKHASHPVNAMLNYAYVVEAGRLAKALAARGLALPIGFLHSDKKGRNSLVWDAIEPIRPAIDARVFAYLASREFARSDFPQTSANAYRLSRDVIGEMLAQAALPERGIADAADFMLQAIERHSGGQYLLFRTDKRRKVKPKANEIA